MSCSRRYQTGTGLFCRLLHFCRYDPHRSHKAAYLLNSWVVHEYYLGHPCWRARPDSEIASGGLEDASQPCTTAGEDACAAAQEYAEQRSSEQEACYNLGRAAHQLGLLHVAVPFYERALAAKPPLASSAANLRREAAHNLVLIYRSTGATSLARNVMQEHLTF